MARQPCKFIASIDGVVKFMTSFCSGLEDAKEQISEIYTAGVEIEISCFQFTTQGW